MVSVVNIILTVTYLITLFYTVFWLLALLDMKPHLRRELRQLPRVTVVVPAYNEESSIEKTMRSVLELDYPHHLLQLIAVNDGSTDGTLALMRKLQREYESRDILVLDQKNQGKWMVLNTGLARATGEFFACLDADSTVAEDALKKMLPYFADDNVAAVLPWLKIANPRNLLQKLQWHEYVINIFLKRVTTTINCIHVVPGPFSVYRIAVLKRVGTFRHGHNTEDLEIALRLQKANYRVLQVTDAISYTEAPANLRELYKQRHRWNRGSFLNALDYRSILFNRSYGDFGLFYMPFVLIAGFITVALFGTLLYSSVLEPLFRNLFNLFLVNFDIYTLIADFQFNFMLLDINFYRLLIASSIILVSAFVVVLAHRHLKVRMFAHGILPLFLFMFFYFFVLAVVWVGVLTKLLLRRKQQW